MESSLSFRCIGGPLRPNLLYVVGSLLLSHILLAQDRAELNALLEPVPHGTPYNERTITTAFDSRVSRDPQNAVRLLLNAANTGDPGAQTSLGYLYAKGKAVPKDEEQALRWFQRAAADNYAPAQYDLGLLLLQAGAHHDENAAVRWLTRAAQQGLAPAQVNLGILYVRGIGVVRDEAEALRWFRKAGKQRFAYAEFLLGMAYEGGNGVKRDFTEAVRWYHKAAEQGHAQAQNNLAGLYRDAVGVAKNVNEALKWYRSAAEQGESTSYSNLMHLYSDGRDMEPNYVEAYRWALLARLNPSPYSRPTSDELLGSLRSHISHEEAKQIEITARNWIAEHPNRSVDWTFPLVGSDQLRSSK